ncbi:MAG: carbohydrate kinase [Frankiales bacterium]|nr:carbohydrate kinase [Frankiales bacterium]
MTSSSRDRTLRAGVTVLGNLSVDHVNGGPPTAGGCPSFAGPALAALGDAARLVVRAAPADLPLFDAMLAALPVPWQVLPSTSTSSFSLVYSGNDRVMRVEGIGPVWTPADIAAAAVATRWVHVAPLLRSDFPAESLAALASAGHLISYDGQGLVRVPRLGPMVTDDRYDPAVLEHVQVLNISEDEAAELLGSLGADAVRRLGVPEVLVTRGVEGSDVYVDGVRTHVPVAWRVDDVQTTGAGDMFTVSYVVARAGGRDPLASAAAASTFVAEQLSLRAAGDTSGT